MNNCFLENKIKYICSNEYKYFLSKENVVGVAYGYKVKNAFRLPKKCICVFVRKKLSKDRLNSKDLIPKSYKGIATDVVESGVFYNNSLTNRVRPVECGYIIGCETQPVGGTLGCIVTDGMYFYILTNAHVLDPLYRPPIGVRVLQPSRNYGSAPGMDDIAIVSKVIPVQLVTPTTTPENYVDCSISRVIHISQVSPKLALIGGINGINTTPIINLDVQKVGAISDLTKGKIVYLNNTFVANVPGGNSAVFKDQILTTPMQSPGDSGSMLLDNGINVVGLCIGSSYDRTIDIVTPIGNVLSSLNVSIVTGY